MSYLVIPNEVFANDALIWVAAINEQFDPNSTVLQHGPNQTVLNTNWSNFRTADGQFTINYQRVALHGLKKQTDYPLTLRVNNEWKADGSFRTIPWDLPGRDERPFIVMLGSCFFAREDANGEVGRTYMGIPTDAKPDVKFLCGDQVYLDNPPSDFAIPFHSRNWLEHRSFQTYLDAWTQQTADGGFGQLLKHGANFFSSDDHEFWNNAPDKGWNVPLYAVKENARKQWWDIAQNLYKIFQTVPGPPVTFKVAPLSFCICETRFSRGPGGADDSDFMSAENLRAIGTWTAGLTGPGVLVLGQPFFAETGSWKDYGLPDFKRQYEELKGYLRQSEHSIVILTGDVHFGRIALTPLRRELQTELYEVISSPMQLVPHAAGTYKAAPNVFGEVESKIDFSQGRDHFLTLEFRAPSPQRVEMFPRFWPIARNGAQVRSFDILSKAIELF
jgi:hypothetical protein